MIFLQIFPHFEILSCVNYNGTQYFSSKTLGVFIEFWLIGSNLVKSYFSKHPIFLPIIYFYKSGNFVIINFKKCDKIKNPRKKAGGLQR